MNGRSRPERQVQRHALAMICFVHRLTQLGFNVRMLQNSSKTLEPVVIFQQRQGSSLENLRLAVGSP